MNWFEIVTTSGVYYAPKDVYDSAADVWHGINSWLALPVHKHGSRGGIDTSAHYIVTFNPAHVVTVSIKDA
jgi:hypothetical protein